LILQWLQSRYNRDDQGGTPSERTARRPTTNIILSRIIGRVKAEDLAIVWRVLIDIGTGQFEGFEPPVTGETQTRDERATITALDIGAAERHRILGQGLNLIEVLPSALNFAAIAFSMGSFEQAADEPEKEIAQARKDAQNALAIGLSLYEAAKGIYGDQAFGLRFFAWFAKKAPDALIDGLILPMMRLRAMPGAILSSEKIAQLAIQARAGREMYARIEQLRRGDPRFRKVFDPKRIRAAYADKISLKRLEEDVRIARDRGVDLFSGDFDGGASNSEQRKIDCAPISRNRRSG
jgi:hypothetical protein